MPLLVLCFFFTELTCSPLKGQHWLIKTRGMMTFSHHPSGKYKMSKLNNNHKIVINIYLNFIKLQRAAFYGPLTSMKVNWLLSAGHKLYLLGHPKIFRLDSPAGGCNRSVPKRSDGCNDDGMFSITEHVGVEASTRQIRVTLAHCQAARRIAERSRVNCSGTGYTHLTLR